MNNVVDEILQDNPKFRILDDQGNIIYDNISIEMITAITQIGTALNKALFDSIKTDLDSRLPKASKATQAQAQAGTDNTNYMTALRVLQEINTHALPSKQISIKTGTVSNGETISQTSGYSNYLYFVSINSIHNIRTYRSGLENYEDYINIDCSVNQSTRVVTCKAEYWDTYTDRPSTVSGTANYIELAWN